VRWYCLYWRKTSFLSWKSFFSLVLLHSWMICPNRQSHRGAMSMIAQDMEFIWMVPLRVRGGLFCWSSSNVSFLFRFFFPSTILTTQLSYPTRKLKYYSGVQSLFGRHFHPQTTGTARKPRMMLHDPERASYLKSD
jgi:hypothetical protein